MIFFIFLIYKHFEYLFEICRRNMNKYEIKRKEVYQKKSFASALKELNRFEYLKPHFIDLSNSSITRLNQNVIKKTL